MSIAASGVRVQAVWLHCSPAEEGHCRAPEDFSGEPPPVDEEESGGNGGESRDGEDRTSDDERESVKTGSAFSGTGSTSAADGVCLGPFDCRNVRTGSNDGKCVNFCFGCFSEVWFVLWF